MWAENMYNTKLSFLDRMKSACRIHWWRCLSFYSFLIDHSSIGELYFKHCTIRNDWAAFRSIDEMTLGQISDAVQFDSGGMRHLLGGITLDSEKRIAGAKAIMLPYALRHSSQVEDWLAEKWELRLADFLLQVSISGEFLNTVKPTFHQSSGASNREKVIISQPQFSKKNCPFFATLFS